MKSISNRKKLAIAMLSSIIAIGAAGSALAQSTSVVEVTGQYGVGVVFDNSDVTGMQPLPGGVPNMNYAGNPTFFNGTQACAIGRDGNYSIDNPRSVLINNPRQPARRPVCTPVVNGQFRVSHPFGHNVDMVLVSSDGRVLGWIADDTVTPNYHN